MKDLKGVDISVGDTIVFSREFYGRIHLQEATVIEEYSNGVVVSFEVEHRSAEDCNGIRTTYLHREIETIYKSDKLLVL